MVMLDAQARGTTDHLAARGGVEAPRVVGILANRASVRGRDSRALLRRAGPTRDLHLSGRHGGRGPDPVATCERAGDLVAHAQRRLRRHSHERMG